MRPVDADALLEEIVGITDGWLKPPKGWKWFEDSVKNAPTLEQPKIVLCKDCKHIERLPWLDDDNFKAMVCRKHVFTGMRTDDLFCADGERKE